MTSPKKRQRGRPARPLPPRVDSTPEELAQRILNAGRPSNPFGAQQYHCEHCGKEIVWPEVLYDDGRCEDCHA